MKKLLATAVLAALGFTNAQAMDIDWTAFKTNYFNTVTAANADAFADAFAIVLRDASISGIAYAVMDKPPFMPSTVVGFYPSASIKTSTCTYDYPTLVSTCIIDGTQAKFGGIPDTLDLNNPAQVKWWSDLIAAIDAAGGGATANMSPFLTAIMAAMSAANADLLPTATTGGKVMLGDGMYFRKSPVTGSISITPAQVDIANGFDIGNQMMPGVNFTSSSGNNGIGAEIVLDTVAKTLRFKAAGDTGFGTAVNISAGGNFALVSATAGKTLDVNVSAPMLPALSATGKLRVYWKE